MDQIMRNSERVMSRLHQQNPHRPITSALELRMLINPIRHVVIRMSLFAKTMSTLVSSRPLNEQRKIVKEENAPNQGDQKSQRRSTKHLINTITL
jgi:hypothetical protein